MIFVAMLIIFLLIKNNKNFQIDNDLKRPFVYVYDDKGNKTNILLIEFIFNEKDNKFFEENKNNYSFIGITSYLEFPNPVVNTFDPYSNKNHEAWKYDYKNMFDAWLYCFRNPEKYLSSNVPKMLMSESDFGDEVIIKPDESIEKKYDFIYSCPVSFPDNNKNCSPDWTASNKNWELAKKCIEIMCVKYKLKGLLVGRKDCKLPDEVEKMVEKTGFINWYDFLKKYKQSKFIFVPNIHDASPRVITEAMCCNIPVLLNKNIIGGWKYINEKTGEFFNDEKDIESVLDKMLKNLKNYTPRKYYTDNFGIVKSGKRLLDFVKKNCLKAKLDKDCRYLVPRFSKVNYK